MTVHGRVAGRWGRSRTQVGGTAGWLKKRGSAHERTIRGFRLTSGGLEVGPVLRGFHGLLTGVPTKTGAAAADE